MSLDITIPSHRDSFAQKKLREALMVVALPQGLPQTSSGAVESGIRIYSTDTHGSGTRVVVSVPLETNLDGPCVRYWFDGDGDCSRHYESPDASVMERPGGWEAGVKAFANDAAQYFRRIVRSLEQHVDDCVELALKLSPEQPSKS